MAEIHIRHNHQLSSDDVRSRLEGIAGDLTRKLHVNCQWRGDELHFKRPGAQGFIELGDKIEGQIREQLQGYLA
jgi:putative polyhydroxyalkanoate system protein